MRGDGVAQDKKEAVRWFTLAANQGLDLAAARLAGIFGEGDGVPVDLVEAYKWLILAHGETDPTQDRAVLRSIPQKLSVEQKTEAKRRADELALKRVPKDN